MEQLRNPGGWLGEALFIGVTPEPSPAKELGRQGGEQQQPQHQPAPEQVAGSEVTGSHPHIGHQVQQEGEGAHQGKGQVQKAKRGRLGKAAARSAAGPSHGPGGRQGKGLEGPKTSEEASPTAGCWEEGSSA